MRRRGIRSQWPPTRFPAGRILQPRPRRGIPASGTPPGEGITFQETLPAAWGGWGGREVLEREGYF